MHTPLTTSTMPFFTTHTLTHSHSHSPTYIKMRCRFRNEDDAWNAVAGGCAAGFLLGVRASNLPMVSTTRAYHQEVTKTTLRDSELRLVCLNVVLFFFGRLLETAHCWVPLLEDSITPVARWFLLTSESPRLNSKPCESICLVTVQTLYFQKNDSATHTHTHSHPWWSTSYLAKTYHTTPYNVCWKSQDKVFGVRSEINTIDVKGGLSVLFILGFIIYDSDLSWSPTWIEAPIM